MRDQFDAGTSLGRTPALRRLLVVLTLVSTIGMTLWGWLQQNRAFLPTPDSKSGRALRYQYQGLTHDIWLILLLIAVGYLISKIFISRQLEARETEHTSPGPVKSCLEFIRNNPITTVLFAAYTVAMISGTTYFYKDMFGWYPDVMRGNFLDNFSLRGNFIAETMRRTDYRFFPLAHQDLHILSWFTIYIKTWMLFSAAELIGIVLLSVQFLNNLGEQHKAKSSTVLLLTALLLIHPSTGTAFFHVIYCERLLCLIFILYINAYLRHLKTHSPSSFYETLLWALIGIFIKDIAILLFIIPPASLWTADKINHRLRSQNKSQASLPSDRSHRLEHWLCSLSLLFITSYIILALIPSSYRLEGAYNIDAEHKIFFDLRTYIFALIAIARTIAIAKGKIRFCLLDAINLSALGYISALAATYEFDAGSYLALPAQLIITINIAWAWIELVEKRKQQELTNRKKTIYAILASAAVISADHMTSKNTFISMAVEQKQEQSYIQSTYEKLRQVSTEIRESGDDVNIIISKKSRFSNHKDNLDQIPYKSLIEYNPISKKFTVARGAKKGSIYTPKVGDLIANLDKSIDLIEPILHNYKTELIYRHNASDRTGIIRRITALQE